MADRNKVTDEPNQIDKSIIEAASCSNSGGKHSVTVLIMAGGTGGHVFPALAVATLLRDRGHRVEWLGTQRGIEASAVPAAGFKLHEINIVGIRGKGWFALVKAPWKLVKASFEALKVIRYVNPDIVLGFGGYASGPGGVAAKLARRSLIIHEQNCVAGTTNRILTRIAKRTLEAFPGTLPGASLVGNPVRGSIVELEQPDTRYQQRTGKTNLLVLGGSLGAKVLNELVPRVLLAIDDNLKPYVWHQAGSKHIESTRAFYGEHGVQARVEPFIDDMAEAYRWADLVIARSGALTVSELSVAGVASILVPFPYAIDDHQTHNARWLADREAAILLRQSDLNEQSLKQVLEDLLSDREQLQSMAKRAHCVALPDAANQVIDICLEVANG